MTPYLKHNEISKFDFNIVIVQYVFALSKFNASLKMHDPNEFLNNLLYKIHFLTRLTKNKEKNMR